MTPSPDFAIVTTEAGLLSLEDEWNALWARSGSRRFTRSFDWAITGWRTTGQPRGRRLHVLVMREAGRPVLIWPLTLRRRAWWNVAGPLGGEFTEYDPVLVEDGPLAVERIRAAKTFLRTTGIDILVTPLAREGGPVQTVLAGSARPHRYESLPSPAISWAGFADWEAYWRSRSKNLRNGTTRRLRRLAERGPVTFALVEDAEECRKLLDWTLRHKIAWLERSGLANDFLRTPEFRAFLLEIGQRPATCGRLVTFVLTCGDAVVATKIGTVDGTRYEGFITAQDPEFASFSPGALVLMDCLKWCQARRLDYDFRIGEEAYKRDWATEDAPVVSYRLATSPWGGMLLRLERLQAWAVLRRDRLRMAVPDRLRHRIKGLLSGRLRDVPQWRSPSSQQEAAI